MARLLLVTLTTMFIFCGCQSAPTFGQSAASAPQARSEGLISGVMEGVASLLRGSEPAVVAVAAAAGPTIDDVLGSLRTVESRLDAIQTRAGRADKRSGQSRDVAIVLVLLNTIMLVALFLVARGKLSCLPSAGGGSSGAVERELRRIRKRQATLVNAISQLQEFAAQSAEDREVFSKLLFSVGEEVKKLEEATSAVEQSK